MCLDVKSLVALDPKKIYAVQMKSDVGLEEVTEFLQRVNKEFGIQFVLFSEQVKLIDAPRNFEVVEDGET